MPSQVLGRSRFEGTTGLESHTYIGSPLPAEGSVDDKILEVFAAAYADVAREFEIVFGTLFPGGDGRLVLTDPADMLLTGVDIEARPPGKKIMMIAF